MKTPNWLDVFLFQLDLALSNARMFRADRMKIRLVIERIFTA